jgi:hypothetical protein
MTVRNRNPVSETLALRSLGRRRGPSETMAGRTQALGRGPVSDVASMPQRLTTLGPSNHFLRGSAPMAVSGFLKLSAVNRFAFAANGAH